MGRSKKKETIKEEERETYEGSVDGEDGHETKPTNDARDEQKVHCTLEHTVCRMNFVDYS